MKKLPFAREITAIAVISLLPAAASAQEPVKTFEDLVHVLQSGDKVEVTAEDGHKIKGTLWKVSTDGLRVRGRTAVVSPDEIVQIRVKRADRLRDGVLTGFFAGAAGGAMLGVATYDAGFLGEGFSAFAGALLGSLAGMVTGAVMDAQRESSVLVYRGDALRRTSVRVIPSFQRDGAAVSVVLSR